MSHMEIHLEKKDIEEAVREWLAKRFGNHEWKVELSAAIIEPDRPWDSYDVKISAKGIVP